MGDEEPNEAVTAAEKKLRNARKKLRQIEELASKTDLNPEQMKKLEQLVRIKDSKIHTMANKMAEHGLV